MHSCLEIRSLDCRFGGRSGLHGIDLRLLPGQVHGLLGPRWAGKTTLLRVLAGEVAPSAGSVLLPRKVALVRAGGPAPVDDQGAQLRLALGRALASDPDVLLLDEPSDGFDAETLGTAKALVRRFATHGGAVVWSARRLDSIADVAGSVTILADGRIRYAGGIEALTALALPGLAGVSLHRAA